MPSLSRDRDNALEILRLLGRIGARGIQDRAALEVDARHVVVVEFSCMVGVALHQPLKAIVDADDFAGAGARFEGDRADDAVDAGSRSAADKNAEIIF